MLPLHPDGTFPCLLAERRARSIFPLPRRRITAEQALQDPWLLDMTSSRSSAWQRAGTGAALEHPHLPERMQAGKGMLGNVLPGMPATLAAGPLHATL